MNIIGKSNNKITVIFKYIFSINKKEVIPTAKTVNSDMNLAFLGILLCSSQFFSIGANILLFNSHVYNFGDDFAKHAAATIKKGVVGNPGSRIPK